VDDAGFDIREHVRTREISAPGDEATLLKVCAELNEPQLDRSRPLWEMWVLTGLADGHVGLLFRLHHVVADGIAALALIGALFDMAPRRRPPCGIGGCLGRFPTRRGCSSTTCVSVPPPEHEHSLGSATPSR
jgi:hypothetical protein